MSDLFHPYDKAARFAGKKSEAALIRLMFPGLAEDIHWVRWHDARLQADAQADDRTCDLIAELRDPQKLQLQLINIEFQYQSNSDEMERGFEYVARIYRQYRGQAKRKKNFDVYSGFVFLAGPAPILELNAQLRGTSVWTRQAIGIFYPSRRQCEVLAEENCRKRE